MGKRRKDKKIYRYECQITGDTFKRTTQAENPDDLMSVGAYYEMNPDKDDRPAVIKKQLGIETTEE